MLQEPDSINKKVVILSGGGSSSTVINLSETIRNVVAIKHIRTSATISSTVKNALQNTGIVPVFTKLNDYNLKEVYNTNNDIIPVFSSLYFETGSLESTSVSSKSNTTGIISNFRADVDNYVFNPLLPTLHKLQLDFVDDQGNSVELQEFLIELCIYSTNAKLTMN